MLRQGLGEKRAHALTKLASEEDVPLLPADTVWKAWAPAIAQYLHRQKRPATAWTQFYADLAKLRDPLPHLRGEAIFVAQGGKLVPANNPLAAGDGPEFFIHQEAERPNRRRKRLSDAALFPPDSLARNMLFSDPLIGWSPQVAQAFIGAGLASEYSLPAVVSKLGRLVGKRPPHLRVLAAVGWAFEAWKTHRTPELESALRASNLRLPAGAGGNQPAGRLRFSAGWRDSQGDLIAELIDAAAAVSREIADIGASVLPTWDAWPLRERGSASEWTQFLKHCGVRDGLPVLTHKAVSVEKWQWAGIKKGDGPELPIERTLGAIWRVDVKEQPTWGFRYNSGAYSTEQTLYVLAGQSAYASFPVQAKLPYARLIARFLLDADTKYFNTKLTRTAGNPDTDLWPSPLAAFLRQQAWMPRAGVDDLEWARPKDCWYAPKGEADVLPRFVQRLERGMREALDGSAALRTIMVDRLGLRLWSAEVTAGDRVAALGAALAQGISEAEHDTFRKAYREAWEHWSALTNPPALPSALVLAVDLGGRLIALPPPVPDQHAPPLLVGETSNPTLTQLLTVIDRPVFSAPDGKSAACAAAIKRAQGRDAELLEGVELGVEVDGQSFAPSADPPLLVSLGREWLAEISVLVLEFNTGLTNRNTARSRQLLYDDLRKVRVVSAQDVAVTIAGERGGLPVGLEGVLPISHADFPTLVVAEAPPEMDWATLARLGSGLALAIGRPGLSLQFRVAFLALSNALAPLHAPFERPDDALVARALAQPVSRVRELYRSLRSTTGRLLDGLIPAVQLRFGTAAAEALLTRRAEFTDEADIAAALVTRGVAPQQVADLIDICRDADGLDDVRQRLGADLVSFNAALSALGGEWSPLRFDERLRRQFTTRQEEQRALLAQTVRDAYVDLFDADGDLTAYRRDSRLEWITFDERWLETYDNLPDELIDARFADLGQTQLPASNASADDGLENLRQANRAALVANLPELRRVARAWVAKEPMLRGLPPSWEATNDMFVRDVVSSGVLDFRRIATDAWPAVLARASAWPTAMPTSLDLEMLGLIASDLELEEQQETKRRDAELKARRTIVFGEIEVDGGQSDRFDQVAAALRDALASSSFRERSGKADLQAFGPKGRRRPGRRGGGKGKDPEYLSEEQRTLLGFAGELAAYHYLKQSVRGFHDACWLSSMGRRYLGLPATNDSDGYDFKVPRTRGDLYFEVKAHVGDPGYVDLERSQVAAAASMASEKRGKWRVLYVSNVQTPELIAVSELPNPFSEAGKVYFREGQHQAVRLKLRRAN
ncbi:MAG: hypothetical protein ACK4YQ_08970 [Phenylobacterium sp.]|uniref:hypothetical protein n=1 Tax=Phenylobacterium sp. TaxID=1871053 RepID=UPI003919513F